MVDRVKLGNILKALLKELIQSYTKNEPNMPSFFDGPDDDEDEDMQGPKKEEDDQGDKPGGEGLLSALDDKNEKV